jgi:hypothetical protein
MTPMDSPLSPSKKPMTDGQIDKAQSLLRAILRRHRSEFSSDVIQEMLAKKGVVLQDEFLAAVRRHVEFLSNMIVRTVLVKYDRTAQEAIDATYRVKYELCSVVAGMPGGGGKNRRVPVTFFNTGRYMAFDSLDKEYAARCLVPADPYALAAVNEADPAFADEHSNGTYWKDGDGNWCFVAFSCEDGKRCVRVWQDKFVWNGVKWFAGVPCK